MTEQQHRAQPATPQGPDPPGSPTSNDREPIIKRLRYRWRRYLDGRATTRDPRWPDAIPWHATQATGFRKPAKMCPRGCWSEVGRRELLTFTTWSGLVDVRVHFDFQATNCEECGSPLIEKCSRCDAQIMAPVADRCEFCGLPQPWAPERLTSKRRTPPRKWDPEPRDTDEPKARDPAKRVYPVGATKPMRQLLVIDDDITNLAVQAIISNDDVDGRMYTVVASAIKAAAGQQVEDLSIDHGRSRLGDAWFTHPGRLTRLRGIIHVAAVDRRGRTTLDVIRKCVTEALDRAVEHDCESVALATFGVEREAPEREVISVEKWIDNVVPTIVDYLERLPGSTRLAVILVLFQPELPDELLKRVEQAATADPSPRDTRPAEGLRESDGGQAASASAEC